MRRVEKLEIDGTEFRRDIKELNQKADQLTEAIRLLTVEFQRDRENAERDREIQRLQLENILLRFDRGLPPAGHKDEPQE